MQNTLRLHTIKTYIRKKDKNICLKLHFPINMLLVLKENYFICRAIVYTKYSNHIVAI